MEQQELNLDLPKLLITLFMNLEFGKNQLLHTSKLNHAKTLLREIFSLMDQELELILMTVLEELMKFQKIWFSVLAENLEIMVLSTVGIDKFT